MSKLVEDLDVWENFVEKSLGMLKKSCYKTRVYLKYRNKPARGRISVTSDRKEDGEKKAQTKVRLFYFKCLQHTLRETKSIDLLDKYTKNVLYTLANKPIEEDIVEEKQNNTHDKKNKNPKKKKN